MPEDRIPAEMPVSDWDECRFGTVFDDLVNESTNLLVLTVATKQVSWTRLDKLLGEIVCGPAFLKVWPAKVIELVVFDEVLKLKDVACRIFFGFLNQRKALFA